MTARSSPHHAAVVRAQVRRRAAEHMRRRKLRALAIRRVQEAREHALDAVAYAMDAPGLTFCIAEGRAAAAKYLRDPPKTEEQKASRWRRIWGGK